MYVDLFKKAKGTLYLDDGESFAYQKGDFIYSQFYYNENTVAFSAINLNEMKTKPNYLSGSEFKKIKFEEISVIGTDLEEEVIKQSKLVVRNLTTAEKYVVKAEENLEFTKHSELNKTLTFKSLERFNLFAHQDFEIILLLI